MTPPTRPTRETQSAEESEALAQPGADPPPSPEEEEAADKHPLTEGVADHEKEMLERGAHQKGEGRLTQN